MRKLTFFMAAAPLALLAACGEPETEEAMDDTDTAAMDSDMADADTMASGATTLESAGDFSGDYSMTADDGTTTSVRLNSQDNSYEYTGADGEVRTGTYTRADDGYRLQIADWYGEPAWFTFSNGQLVRLGSDMEMNAESTVEGERYTRADAEENNSFTMGSPAAMQDDDETEVGE